MTDKQINLAIGAITHAELVMDFPDVVLDALNSVIALLATMDEQPERKKGRWELCRDEKLNIDYYKCSECGYEPYRKMDISNFCPNCGCQMEVGEK